MMYHCFSARGIRAAAMAFLILTAILAGCGKDGGDLTSPPPSDPGPTDPGPTDPGVEPWPGPAPVGTVVYAVDLGNTFYVFGSESFNVLTAKMKITGLPILKRIIGITIRPSDGKLYGVGTDSRVYTIDPLTAVATSVSSTPFSPKIFDAFDIHFAMDLEPNGARVRLIAAESGENWSISLDDGTATTGETSHYGAGTGLENETPRLLGMYYRPAADRSDPTICQNLAYAVDADQAIMIASCDPATGEWWPTVTGDSSQTSAGSRSAGSLMRSSRGDPQQALEDLKDQILRCGEALPSPVPSNPNAPKVQLPNPGEPWFPRTPDTPTWLFIVDYAQKTNSIALAEAAGLTLGVTTRGSVPADAPIQSATWVHPAYVPMQPPPPQPVSPGIQLSAARDQEQEPAGTPSDPRARCM
jgi:hypothetical protein